MWFPFRSAIGFCGKRSFRSRIGLLSVVVMGMFLGNSDLPNLKELLYFKESLSVLLISILFILLAANIKLDDLLLIYNWNTAILLSVVIFLLRPLAVFMSTVNSSLKFNEKLFISWVGPRGIVAAGIASLFGTKLVLKGVTGAEYITPLVFAVVLVTVLLNATTARFFASVVGVFLKTSEGILIVGASKVSRLIASYLQKNGRHVVLVDSNQANVAQARELDLEAITANIYAEDLASDVELSDVGYLLALTGSGEINRQAINRFGKIFGETGTFRLMSSEEKETGTDIETKELFSTTHDFVMLEEVARTFPSIQEIPVETNSQFLKLLKIIEKDDDTVALFLKMPNGFLEIIASPRAMEVNEDCHLVYLGKPLDIEELNTATRSRKHAKE